MAGPNPIIQPPILAEKPSTKATKPKADISDPNAYAAENKGNLSKEEIEKRREGARIARGRKRGGINSEIKAKLSQAEAFASAILADSRYQMNLMHRAITGNLAPGLEALLWYYKFGRPVKRVEVSGAKGDDLSTFSNHELADRAKDIASTLLSLEKEAMD